MVYQLWIQSREGPRREVLVDCSDDLEAFEAAVPYLTGGAVEIWRGKKLIATLRQISVS